MQPWPVVLVGILARIAAFQLLTWLILQWGLKRFRFDTPEASRLVCLAVLVQGLLFLPWTVSIPWYDPPPEAVEVALAGVAPATAVVDEGTSPPVASEPTGRAGLPPNPTISRQKTAPANWNARAIGRTLCEVPY